MGIFRQTVAVTRIGLSGLPHRIGSSVVVIVGIAGVVAVLLSFLAMAGAVTQTIANSGRVDRAIVLTRGADAEGGSGLSRAAVATILTAPGIKSEAKTGPRVSPEFLTVTSLAKKTDGSRAEVGVRGITKHGFVVRSEFRLTAGRLLSSGRYELLAGRAAQAQFKGLEIGDAVSIRGAKWTVVGAFETAGDSHESELLADAGTVMPLYQAALFNSVTVQLDSAASFDTFKKTLSATPSLSVDAYREQDYYRQRSEKLGTMIAIITYLVGGIMALGAMFGAINTMYIAVSSRSREIATLRSIGFRPFGVVASVLIEAQLFALIGAGTGAAIAWLAFNGNTFSTLSGDGQIVARLQIGASLFAIAVAWACAIGLIGGLFPAIRAGRQEVAIAFRAS